MSEPKSASKGKFVQIGKWQVQELLATARIEGRGPTSVADECRGHCCLHGVYLSLYDRDRILDYADQVRRAMDETQTPDTSLWFEDKVEEDEDFRGGLCVGTSVYNHKCAFLNGEGLCVLQLLEPSLNLPEGERLKPFYCRLFPLTTCCRQLEFDDLCDGVRPCCTLVADGTTRAIDAFAYELREALGEEGYEELRGVAAQLEQERAPSGRA